MVIDDEDILTNCDEIGVVWAERQKWAIGMAQYIGIGKRATEVMNKLLVLQVDEQIKKWLDDSVKLRDELCWPFAGILKSNNIPLSQGALLASSE